MDILFDSKGSADLLSKVCGSIFPSVNQESNADLGKQVCRTLPAEMASLRLVLAGGRAEAEAFAHALPESFPLFGRHVLATLFHAAAETGATGTVPSQSAEEDPAQRQQSQRLPKGDLAPAEERRQQPIPEVQHYFAADEDKEQQRQDRQRSNENPFLSHVQSLMLS